MELTAWGSGFCLYLSVEIIKKDNISPPSPQLNVHKPMEIPFLLDSKYTLKALRILKCAPQTQNHWLGEKINVNYM